MKILTGLAALLLSGALACTDEMLPAPSAEAPSCKEGRIWYESTCIDPSAQEERENPVPEQRCEPQAERACIGRFSYAVDSCGILDQETPATCSLYDSCRDGYCVEGELFFSDNFDSLSQWRVKGGTDAFLEDGVVEMGEGSIESRERYDRTLIDEQHSVVLTYVARMDNVQMVFSSNICQIRNDGVAACWDGLGPTVLKEVQTGIDPFDWHVYTMRMETVPDSYHQTWMDVTLAIDNREVLTSRMARIGLYNLILFWCYWDEAGTTSNTCWLDYMDVRRPDHW